MLDEDVAQPKARPLLDVLEQNRSLALRRQRTDIIDRDRLTYDGEDVGIGLEIPAQILVKGTIVGRADGVFDPGRAHEIFPLH